MKSFYESPCSGMFSRRTVPIQRDHFNNIQLKTPLLSGLTVDDDTNYSPLFYIKYFVILCLVGRYQNEAVDVKNSKQWRTGVIFLAAIHSQVILANQVTIQRLFNRRG